MLVLGILVVLAVFSAAIGIAAMRQLRYGYVGLAIFAAIGLAAALTRPNAGPWDVLPTLIGALAGAFALRLLVRAAGSPGRPGARFRRDGPGDRRTAAAAPWHPSASRFPPPDLPVPC